MFSLPSQVISVQSLLYPTAYKTYEKKQWQVYNHLPQELHHTLNASKPLLYLYPLKYASRFTRTF